MFEYLKKQPLIGLALAIAAGYVIAHFAILFLEELPYSVDRNSDTYITVFFWTTVVAGLGFLYRNRRSLATSVRLHKRIAAAVIIAGLLASLANAGRMLTADLALGVNGSEARTRADVVAVADFSLYLFALGVITAITKIIGALSARRRTQS